MQLRVIEMAISQGEDFLDRVFRNSIRIIDKQENEIIHSFYTECIDDSLAEMRISGYLKPFIKKFGAHFRFIDKFGETINFEDESKFSLANILNLNVDEDDEGVWKEFYIEYDDSIIKVAKQPKKDKKKKDNEN